MSTETKKPQSIHLPKGLILPYLISLRVINSVTINTFFQPDEYWQSLEPAHNFTFGYGYQTWEWTVGLRSFFHPLLFSLVYSISEWLDLGDLGVIYFPKILQAIFAAIGEYYLYEFIHKLTKNEIIARWTLFLSVSSAFNWFLITRTFANSLELTLTSIALAYWPWHINSIDYVALSKSLVFSSLSCFLRPTNVLIWLFLGIDLIWSIRGNLLNISKVLIRVVVIGLLVFTVNTYIDYIYYGKLTIPLWNFIQFNVVSSLSKFYGVAPWHFHIFQSVPVTLLTFLPFFIYGLLKYPILKFKILLAFVIGSFSLIGHKEFRFIYPLQPIFFLFTAYGFYHLNLHHSKLIKVSLYVIILLNLAISLFFTQIHERGVIDVINYLKYDPDVSSVGFLTPCHSTPWQSHLHRDDIDAWFLTCEPPLHLLGTSNSSVEVEHYKDETDIFYEDPKTFLFKNFPPPFKKELRSPGVEYKYEWPSHLVIFQDLEELIVDYLKDSPYQECTRFFNTYFHWDDRRRGDVIVYCKWPWE